MNLEEDIGKGSRFPCPAARRNSDYPSIVFDSVACILFIPGFKYRILGNTSMENRWKTVYILKNVLPHLKTRDLIFFVCELFQSFGLNTHLVTSILMY